jgi:hypothetical protein
MFELNSIYTKKDIAENNGNFSKVIGIYTEIDVRKMQTTPAEYYGHVAVVFEQKKNKNNYNTLQKYSISQ